MNRILIVDDEPLTRDFFLSQTRAIDSGWEVAGAASDGEEALTFLRRHPVELVITDIRMPVMDGLELCRRIRQEMPSLEIAILSGFDEFQYAQQAIQYEVGGYLLKPIHIEDLKKLLHDVSVRLQQKKTRKIALEAMDHLSVDYHAHVCRSYLRAIIGNSYTDIQILHPLIHRMKIDLMQAQGIILVLCLDVDSMLLQHIPTDDLTVFRFILYQISMEIMQEKKEPNAYVILDKNENTVLYLTGNEDSQLVEKCQRFYAEIAVFFREQTHLSVTGFAGPSQSDILEMDVSYRDAVALFPLSAIEETGILYDCRNVSEQSRAQAQTLNAAMMSGVNSMLEKDECRFHSNIETVKGSMKDFTLARVTRYLLLMIHILRSSPAVSGKPVTLHEYLSRIADFCSHAPQMCTSDDIIRVFTSILGAANEQDCSEPDAESAPEMVEHVKRYIYQHFSEPITLSQIAEEFHVTPNYLSHIFHETAGESYIKFITRIRMEYASNLLRTTKEHVFEISEKAGYYNLKHFNFVFKEYYHMTPTEYQKKFCNNDIFPRVSL